jgi:hypothetical protein
MRYNLAGPAGNALAVIGTYRQFLRMAGFDRTEINNRCAELLRMPYADILEKITEDSFGAFQFYNSDEEE